MQTKLFKNTLQQVQQKENDVFLVQSENPIVKSNEMILFLSNVLGNLKAKVLKNSFASEQDEIYFFKEIKPQISSKILFYQKVISIESLRPMSNLQQQIQYYETLINKTQKQLNDNELYEYNMLNKKDRDCFYFLRSNSSTTIIKKDFFLK